MFRVALLGRWHVHAHKSDERFLKEFLQLPDCKVTCVWDKDPEIAREWGAEHGYEVETELEAVLSRDDVDGVIVTSEPQAHREIFIAAAKHGKHIFTEKVLSLSVEEALEIRDAIVESGIHFCISFYRLSIRQIAYAKALIENGTIGTPVMLRCMCNVPVGLMKGAVPDYWFDPEVCGGGAMLDLGFNSVYISRYLLGEMESVSSTFSNTVMQGKAEDCGYCTVKYKNGAIGVVDVAYTAVPLSTFEITLYGTKGTYHVRFGGNDVVELQLMGQSKQTLLPEDIPEQPIEPVVKTWVDACTKGGSDVEYGIEAAVDMVKFMTAAYESEKTGKRVII